MQLSIRMGVPLMLLASTGAGSAQTACFSNVAEAVAGKGHWAANGFRLEGTMRDRLSGELWAQVGRCGHPEWPTLLVKAPAFGTAVAAKMWRTDTNRPQSIVARPEIGAATETTAVPVAEEAAVRAGETVTISEHSALVRLEVGGVALSNGRVGDEVKCRVGNQQFVVGTVKQRGVVEIQ